MFLGGIITLVIQRKRNTDAKLKIAETEMKALRAQMNPHFIFNALNSISKYISRHDAETAEDYLARFAQLMRRVLENSDHMLISLKEDIQTLELYIQLESNRLDHSFDYQINIDPEIDPEKTLIPPMILQPFVENSIWHGIQGLKNANGFINISFSLENSTILHCCIQDNGSRMSISADNFRKMKSFGKKLTFDRIKIMNNNDIYIPESTFNLLENGSIANIYLPFIEDYS